MNSSSPTADSLSEGIQHLRLADKNSTLLTPPPSDDSQKSQKSTSNHSDHENSKVPQDKTAYIESLKEERDQLTQFSDEFNHVFTLIDKEIKRIGGGDLGDEKVMGGANPTSNEMLSEIIMVPVEQYPTYNFVGRILGPRGTTAKQLESSTGCRVTIHGRNKKDGSVTTDSSPSVDNGPLRVEISVPADAPEAAKRMETGVNVVKALLIPPADGQDELKRQQLMVLANMNGTYKPRNAAASPLQFSGAGDYGHQFQNLLPYGYRLPVKSLSQHESKMDCFNPKCAILRGLIEQNTNNHNPIPKIDDVLSVMHMYELMNRIRLANSSLFGRQEEMSKAQEIGNRMCSSIGVPRSGSSSSSTATSASPRRLYNVKSRQQASNANK